MISLEVHEESQVAEARRVCSAVARQHGFSDVDTGRVALVATELATNLLKHASKGEVLAGPFDAISPAKAQATGIQILALDQGRGMANLEACVTDGYSSAGTAGKGLGAVMRQSDFVDIASWPGLGTAILAQVMPGNGKSKLAQARPHIGAVSVALPGEEVCGDSWAVDESSAAATLFVADGLGHGPDAAEAAVEAVRLFHRFQGHVPATLLDYIHGGLRATRGAAVSVARYEPELQQVTFAGIGNVAGALATRDGDLRRMVSMPGTAGYNVRKIRSFQYPFAGGLVILCSDGLSTSWALSRYPNLHAAHPVLIAAVLYRDFGRRRDDATVLVGKWPSAERLAQMRE